MLLVRSVWRQHTNIIWNLVINISPGLVHGNERRPNTNTNDRCISLCLKKRIPREQGATTGCYPRTNSGILNYPVRQGSGGRVVIKAGTVIPFESVCEWYGGDGRYYPVLTLVGGTTYLLHSWAVGAEADTDCAMGE
jgi:hypothetical protein